MKRGAAAELDLIKFMTEVRKGANSKKLDAHAKVFAHDLKQQQLAVLQSMNPDGANFEDECRKAKPLADRLTDMVATDILASSSKKEMVHVIEFYLKVAHESLKAGDYQSALFLSTAVNGMDISRLGISDDISKQAKAQLAEIRGVIDNNQRFKQFNQFLKTQNGPNIVPITSSIQAQYVGLKEKKGLADTDEVKESLQTGIDETKGILRNYVQSADPEPMQSNLMAKLAAPTIPYDAAYSSDEKDQPEPLSIEGRSRILKKAGANQTINPNTPEAKASTAAVTQYLKTQPASPLPQLPPTAQQPAPLSPQPVAASSTSDKGKEEEKAEGPLLEPIEQAATQAPQAHSKYKVGGKVDAKGRKRYEEDGGPNPEASQPQAAASSNDKGKEEEKAPVASREPVEPAAADAKAKKQNDLSFMDVTPIDDTPKAALVANQQAAKAVAEALMQRSMKMMEKIQSSEIVNHTWADPKSAIDKMVKSTIDLTNRVRDTILLTSSEAEQVKVLKFMLNVMQEAKKAGDLNTANAIYQGIDNVPVNRLKYLYTDPDVVKMHYKAEAFFSPTRNSKILREYTLKQAKKGNPVVPSIALLSKDLTITRENVKDDNGKFVGHEQISDIYYNFQISKNANQRKLGMPNGPTAVLDQWLQAPVLTEPEADARSAAIKPRDSNGVVAKHFQTPLPTRAEVFAAKAAALQQAPVAQPSVAGSPPVQAPQMPVASSSSSVNSEGKNPITALPPTAPSVQDDKGKKNATDNISEELKAAEPDKVKKARKIRIPKRVEGKPSGPAPVPPSGSDGPVAQQLANEAPKTPKRKTVRFANDAKPQEPTPTRPPSDRAAQLIKLKALSNAYKASSSAYQEYKESRKAEQSQIAQQPAVPTQPTAASVDAGLNPIINDAKQTDAKNKAQDLLNGLSKVNAPQVKLSDAGKVEFTVSGNRNSKALRKALEKAGIECQVKKGNGGTTFSFDADKLNALSNQDVKNLVKATRAEFKELTKELKEKRRTAVVPESTRAEEAQRIAASLREKAPLPALPVVKVDPPANTTPPPVVASPVDAAAQLANMLNNPMPSSNITAPPLETTAPQPQGFGKPGRRAGLEQAAALGNDKVREDAKPPMVNSYKAANSYKEAKGFWEAQEKSAKEEKGAERKPIKPT